MKQPVYIKITNGSTYHYSDREMTILHRADGPAFETSGGYKAWWLDGKLHRADGPAIEWSSGGKEWYVNGKRHRTDGPAIEWSGGTKAWHLDGKRLTEKEFVAATAPTTVELTLDEIADKLGINVTQLRIKD